MSTDSATIEGVPTGFLSLPGGKPTSQPPPGPGRIRVRSTHVRSDLIVFMSAVYNLIKKPIYI